MTNTLSSIVLAIWLAEGGTNAVVPYGILSVPVRKIKVYETTNLQLLHVVRPSKGNEHRPAVQLVLDRNSVQRSQAYDNTNNQRGLRPQVQTVRQIGSNTSKIGSNTKQPMPVLYSQAHAREICERTVLNNWRRWTEAGRPGCYFDFLGDRYVGPNDPRGRVNWKRNVRSLLKHQRCNCK